MLYKSYIKARNLTLVSTEDLCHARTTLGNHFCFIRSKTAWGNQVWAKNRAWCVEVAKTMFPPKKVCLVTGEVSNLRNLISISKASKSSEGKISVLRSELGDQFAWGNEVPSKWQCLKHIVGYVNHLSATTSVSIFNVRRILWLSWFLWHHVCLASLVQLSPIFFPGFFCGLSGNEMCPAELREVEGRPLNRLNRGSNHSPAGGTMSWWQVMWSRLVELRRDCWFLAEMKQNWEAWPCEGLHGYTYHLWH
jgi:hypothetical protein